MLPKTLRKNEGKSAWEIRVCKEGRMKERKMNVRLRLGNGGGQAR